MNSSSWGARNAGWIAAVILLIVIIVWYFAVGKKKYMKATRTEHFTQEPKCEC
jgi:hypothetical protein